MPASKIQDLAYNLLASPTNAQFLGYEEVEEAEVLNLLIYRFLTNSLRKEDEQNGLTLKRYIESFQQTWKEHIHKKIFDVKDLWSYTKIKDEYLIYLKNIVGWTEKYESITDNLSYDQLRRLIALSVEFWKNRGVESNTIDFLQFLTNAPCRIWNWFDLRWVVDETILSEDHQGRDPFILSNPGYGDSEYYSSVRIVDDGNLNRTLVESAVKLIRASGERIVVNYLLLLDLFNRDEGWWLGNQVIEDGVAKLDNTSTSEFCIYNDNNMEVWQNYTAYFRIRGESGSTFGAYFYCTLISSPTTFRGYYAGISVSTNQVVLWRTDPVLSLTYLVTQSYASWGILKEDVWYGLRVQTQNKAAGGVNIRVYVDSDLIIEYDDNTYTEGGVGVGHFALSTCQLDEVEVFNLPADSKLIDINT